jgi:hypothetical protein
LIQAVEFFQTAFLATADAASDVSSGLPTRYDQTPAGLGKANFARRGTSFPWQCPMNQIRLILIDFLIFAPRRAS